MTPDAEPFTENEVKEIASALSHWLCVLSSEMSSRNKDPRPEVKEKFLEYKERHRKVVQMQRKLIMQYGEAALEWTHINQHDDLKGAIQWHRYCEYRNELPAGQEPMFFDDWKKSWPEQEASRNRAREMMQYILSCYEANDPDYEPAVQRYMNLFSLDEETQND